MIKWWKENWDATALVVGTVLTILLTTLGTVGTNLYGILSFFLFMEIILIPIVALLILIKLGVVKDFNRIY